MRSIAEYIICVSAAAFVCGILNSLMLKGPSREILKLVSGLFLAFCVIRPISQIRIPELQGIGESWYASGAEFALEGEALALESLSESISAQLEAYILDKASQLDLSLTVDVVLEEGESCLPKSVMLWGEAPLYAKHRLTQQITEALGLSEEDVHWIKVS